MELESSKMLNKNSELSPVESPESWPVDASADSSQQANASSSSILRGNALSNFSLVPLWNINTREFTDNFEKVTSYQEQLNFIHLLLKMNSSFIEKFASYKGLRIINKILAASLDDPSIPTELTTQALTCLDRISMKADLLEKTKIHSTVDQLKRHREAPEEVVKKAFKLLVKWKSLVDEEKAQEPSLNDHSESLRAKGKVLYDKNRIGKDYKSVRHTNNGKPHFKFNIDGKPAGYGRSSRNGFAARKDVDLLGKRRNPQDTEVIQIEDKKSVRFFDYLTECQVKVFKKEEEPSQCAITEEEKNFQRKIIFGGPANNMVANKPKTAPKGILKKKKQEPEPKPQKVAQPKVEIVPQDLTVDIFAKLLNNNLNDAEKEQVMITLKESGKADTILKNISTLKNFISTVTPYRQAQASSTSSSTSTMPRPEVNNQYNGDYSEYEAPRKQVKMDQPLRYDNFSANNNFNNQGDMKSYNDKYNTGNYNYNVMPVQNVVEKGMRNEGGVANVHLHHHQQNNFSTSQQPRAANIFVPFANQNNGGPNHYQNSNYRLNSYNTNNNNYINRPQNVNFVANRNMGPQFYNNRAPGQVFPYPSTQIMQNI